MDWLATIHITDEIGLTGIATAGLAGATMVLAWWTRRAVKQSGTEIERAQRPVLVPKIDASQRFMPWSVGGALALAPTLHDRTLFVPVRNVGMGPALRVRAHVAFGDVEGKASTSGIEATTQLDLAGISHDEPWVILSFRQTPVKEVIGFVLTLTYEDVAGQMWTSTARYSQVSETFPVVEIEAS